MIRRRSVWRQLPAMALSAALMWLAGVFQVCYLWCFRSSEKLWKEKA